LKCSASSPARQKKLKIANLNMRRLHLNAYREVMPVEQEFPQQLERLPPRDVIVRVQQLLVLGEDLVEVGLQEICSEHLVLRKQLLKKKKKHGQQ
jgi:hypothetical protein